MTVICPTFLLESGTFFREYLLLLQFDDFLYLFFKVCKGGETMRVKVRSV